MGDGILIIMFANSHGRQGINRYMSYVIWFIVLFFVFSVFTTRAKNKMVMIKDNVVFRKARMFYVLQNVEFSVEDVKEYLQEKPCSGFNYTYYVERERCKPVPVKSMFCGGTCKSKQKCNVSCRPIFVKRKEGMLCTPLKKKTRLSLELIYITETVVKACGCTRNRCKSK